MKKAVLFVIGTLQSGGVSKSIVNLLNVFDRKKYETHLLLLSKQGDVLKNYIPKDVIIHHRQDIEDLHCGMIGVIHLMRRFRLWLALESLLRMVLSRIDRAKAGVFLAKLLPRFTDEEFDLIVDYGGQQQLYYMVDKLKGKKKVAFFHNDYSKWSYYYKADKKYYAFVDHIYSISDTCVQVLKDYFPEYADKISVMENISSPGLICQQAEAPIGIEIPKDKVILATLGHLCRRKGWDFAIDAAKILKREHIPFVWLQIGKIIETDLVDRIREAGLEDCFFFVGIQYNPYPYIKACDIYVHPSRFEGKSIALDEAKILCKPIVVTNFSTVNDQFEDRVNASICEMSGEDVAAKIMELISDVDLKNRYIDYLHNHVYDNSSEINKLYQFLEA